MKRSFPEPETTRKHSRIERKPRIERNPENSIFVQVCWHGKRPIKTFVLPEASFPRTAKATYFVLDVGFKGFEDQSREEKDVVDFVYTLADDRVGDDLEFATPLMRAGLLGTSYTGDIPFGAKVLTIFFKIE